MTVEGRSSPVRQGGEEVASLPPDRRGAILDALAADPDIQVRCRVAAHPLTPPATLARLALDPDEDVQWWVATHPGTPPETLAEMAARGNDQLAGEVAANPSTPPGTVSELLGDPTVAARRDAIMQLKEWVPRRADPDAVQVDGRRPRRRLGGSEKALGDDDPGLPPPVGGDVRGRFVPVRTRRRGPSRR